MTELLLKMWIKDYQDTDDVSVRNSYGILGGCVGIACNLLLFVGKFFAGFITGAISITADAFNNLSDAASSIISLVGFYLAGKPADEDHPYGHGRMEYVSGFVVSLAILLMGFEILRTSIQKIIHPEDITFRTVSIVILVLSILVKFWMGAFNRYLGEKIQSETMKATATDSFNDCISTAAVLVGMGIFRFLGYNIDGWIGLFVAGFVLWGGYGAFKDTMDPLIGSVPDAKLSEDISREVMSYDLIIGVHDMMIHDYGPGNRIVSLHAEVPSSVDILEAHDIIDSIEIKLMEKFQCEATIHMDPIVVDDEEVNQMRDKVIALVEDYDSTLSIHDFRMVTGKTHTNIIFDLEVPYGNQYDVKKILKNVRQKIQEGNSEAHKLFAVITVDRIVPK